MIPNEFAHLKTYICNVNSKLQWVGSGERHSGVKTIESLIVPSISFHVIKGHKYADIRSLQSVAVYTPKKVLRGKVRKSILLSVLQNNNTGIKKEMVFVSVAC